MLEVEDHPNTQLRYAQIIQSRKLSGLPKENSPQPKLYYQRIFIWFFNEPATERVENLDYAANDLEDFILK
jgi:hypothetical protein